MRKYILTGMVILTGLLFSCSKNEIQNPVPDVPFDVQLNLTLPLYEPLRFPMGGIVFYDAGSKGLAILRISESEFAIFDRHCTYKVEDGCRVDIEEDVPGGLIDKDCCGSKFNMINQGLPSEGPANIGLKAYQYTFNGTILRIYNY